MIRWGKSNWLKAYFVNSCSHLIYDLPVLTTPFLLRLRSHRRLSRMYNTWVRFACPIYFSRDQSSSKLIILLDSKLERSNSRVAKIDLPLSGTVRLCKILLCTIDWHNLFSSCAILVMCYCLKEIQFEQHDLNTTDFVRNTSQFNTYKMKLHFSIPACLSHMPSGQ